jgi:hypothetical protein
VKNKNGRVESDSPVVVSTEKVFQPLSPAATSRVDPPARTRAEISFDGKNGIWFWKVCQQIDSL